MILAKRPRSDAEHGRAGSREETKITSNIACFFFHPGPWYVDVFNQLPGWGLSQKVSELNFLLSIGSQPYHPNLPSRVGFHSWLFGGKKTFHCAAARPIHRQLLIESTQRALVSSTIVFAFVMKIFISHFIICCFFIPNSFCAKPVFCLGKKKRSQILFECRIQQPIALSDV